MRDSDDNFLLRGGNSTNPPCAVIKDYKWWIRNVNKIDKWLDDAGIKTRYIHEGRLLIFECKEDLAMFVLRWRHEYENTNNS